MSILNGLIKEVGLPLPPALLGTKTKSYVMGMCRILVSQEPDGWHLSISHPHRYPSWDEIKVARYALTPDEVTMAMILPPKGEFVSIHTNCFHLFEIRDKVRDAK